MPKALNIPKPKHFRKAKVCADCKHRKSFEYDIRNKCTVHKFEFLGDYFEEMAVMVCNDFKEKDF